MSKFLQLHILTPYPPSNPNRDDLGRPKTAILGGTTRQRISSQAIKRAIRTSEVFESHLQENALGLRTRRFGSKRILPKLLSSGVEEAKALEIVSAIVGAVASVDEKSKNAEASQMIFMSEEELELSIDLAVKWANDMSQLPLINKKENNKNNNKNEIKKVPDFKKIAREVLKETTLAADIAMFGRMLTGTDNAAASFGMDAAIQVSHAFTTNTVVIEDDYYTAADDLKSREEDPDADSGAGFIGETGFGSGVFYVYICVDRDTLVRNLGGDDAARELARKSMEALVRAAATASPPGKRNSFANHVRAEFILAEAGDAQPRTLASAFLKPVGRSAEQDQKDMSADLLLKKREEFAKVYGTDWDSEKLLWVGRQDSATLDEIATFAGEAIA